MLLRSSLLAVVLVIVAPTIVAADEVTLKQVDVDGFLAEVAKHKGKVVVVDFWADFCIPCKKEFPNLVKLHQKHNKHGLTAMSVSFDDPEDKELTMKFLQNQEAAFPNLIVEDSTPFQEKWDFTAIPTTLVFGRDGKLAKKFSWDNPDDQFTYEDVEKFVEPLVKKK